MPQTRRAPCGANTVPPAGYDIIRCQSRHTFEGWPAVPGSVSPQERATFGLKELDGLLGGGLTRQTSTLLTGSLGTGKSLLALLAALRARGVTLLAIKETPKVVTTQLDFSADALAVLAENVLLLQQLAYRGRLHRVLSVLKMRFSTHDYTLREMRIAPPEGIHVLTPDESGREVLAGLTRQQGGPAAEGGEPLLSPEASAGG